jgi:3-deoxy-manno-octulosonate cytidylyltransferase (CMP-KDO synthetase)
MTLGVIPARYGSTRLEGKVLALIGSKPMIQHVYERARGANLLDDLVIAVDDERVFHVVESFGGKAVMTSASHTCGTERVEEVAARSDSEIIVNIQGDEPFVKPEMIDETINLLLEDPSVPMATLLRQIKEEELMSPGIVKAVLDANGFALYFSRAPIPHAKNRRYFQAYEHLGIYCFRKAFLSEFVKLGVSPLEETEGLEMLRVLENGYKIKAKVTKYEYNALSVDTKEDLETANRVYERMMTRA